MSGADDVGLLDGANPSPEGRPTRGDVDARPTPTAALLSLAAGAVALAVTTLGGGEGALLGGLGGLGVAAGVLVPHRGTLWAGAGTMVLGALVAGAAGAGPLVTLPAATAAIVAWDAGEYAIVAGRQVGRAAGTPRTEALHVGVGAIVGVTAAGSGYLVYRFVGGGHPVAALVVLLVAALALATALRT